MDRLEKKKYTYEDYLKTPDDVRYELIKGELLMTPAPNARFGVKEYGIAILEGRGVGSNCLCYSFRRGGS